MSMVEEVKEHLLNVIVPFWSGLRDDEYGGFYGMKDYDLKVNKKYMKGVILHSRILWFFSSVYKQFQDEKCLSNANHAYEYVKEHCIDKEYGGVYWATKYNGEVEDATKHTYNMAFTIYALSSYYDATNNEEAIKLAGQIYDVIENKCRDEIGYLEAFDRTFHPAGNEKLSENGVEAKKTMNTLLHVFEAYTEYYRVTKKPEVKERLEWILDMFADKVYNKELKRQEVFFDENMNSILDLHSYGHDIETSWLIDRGCEILGEQHYTEKMSPITKALTKTIYDTAFHKNSLWNECEKGVPNKNRVWWVQAETVIGFLNGYQHDTSKKEYLEAARAEWHYIKENLVDKRPGSEWFWELDDDGKPIQIDLKGDLGKFKELAELATGDVWCKPIVEPWKCPYHNGRMCLEVIRRNVDA